VPANRGTSSKSPRFFRHRRRFADFPAAAAKNTRTAAAETPEKFNLAYTLSLQASDRCHRYGNP